MIIKNGSVFSSAGVFEKKDLYIANGIISDQADLEDIDIIDASGLYVLPGLVDIHTHGAVGHDFCDADANGLSDISVYERSNGITSFCPTSMAFPEDKLSKVFRTINMIPNGKTHARIAGINMEGPFISPSKKGAQKESNIMKIDIDMFNRLNQLCGGNIRLVTIAPEIEGANQFIDVLHDTVAISLGHSSASYNEAFDAFSTGANHVTHLFNAMSPFQHRDTGIVGAASDMPNVMVEIICDGVHLHPSMIRNIFRIFGDDRVILISDSMEATGMKDGTYELGGQTVYKKGRHATLSDGTIAGSVTNLADSMRKAISFGIPLVSAIKAATINPAKSIGLSGKIGNLIPEAYADIILMDKELNFIKLL